MRMRRVKATAAAAASILPVLLQMATAKEADDSGMRVVAAVSAGSGSACALYRAMEGEILIDLLVANPSGSMVRC